MTKSFKIISIVIMLFATISLVAQTTKNINFFEIKNGSNKTKLVVDNKKEGALIIAKSSAKFGSYWRIVKGKDGLVRIRNRFSGKYLANYGSSKNGAPIRQTATPKQGAAWKLIKIQGGHFKIQNFKTKLFLSLKELPNTNEFQLIQTNELSGLMAWQLVKANVQNQNSTTTSPTNTIVKEANNAVFYKMENIAFKQKLANNGNKAEGAPVFAKPDVKIGGHWELIKQDNGYLRIRNRHSKKYLATYGSKKSGTVIRQTDKPKDGALWKRIPAMGGNSTFLNKGSQMFLSLKYLPNKKVFQAIQTTSQGKASQWTAFKIKRKN